MAPRFQRITLPVQDELPEGLLQALVQRVAAHKRLDADKIVGTL